MSATVTLEAAQKRRRRLSPRSVKFLTVFGVFVLLMVLWQLYVSYIYKLPLKLPTPGSTVGAAWLLIRNGDLRAAMASSYLVLLVGSVPAVILGILGGLLIGSVRRLDIAFSPYLFAFFSTPFPALIPVFVIIFGLGLTGKAAIVFTLVFFMVLLQTIAGVKSVDKRYLEVAESFGSPGWRTIFEVTLPAASGFIVVGIRLAVGRALVGVVISEFDTALSGLGALIFNYSGRMRLAEAFVPAVVLAITGIILSTLLRRAEKRVSRWKMAG